MANCAFLGLGIMGFPMAGHLADAGHRVRVFNRTAEKAEAWTQQHAGTLAESPRLAALGADYVFLCLGDDPDVRAVVLGEEGALAGAQQGAVLVDHTTTSAALARELERVAQEQGVAFLDAPVSGGQAGAEAGALTVMVGGEEKAFRHAEPLMAAYGKAVTWMGASGSGQLTKMVNQLCIAGLIQGLAEGLSFGQRAGLDMDRVVSVISKGAAQSWQMDNRAATMLNDEFNHGFPIEWMRKDLRICMEEARANGSEVPVAALVDQFFQMLVRQGGRRWDTSALIRNLRDANGDGQVASD